MRAFIPIDVTTDDMLISSSISEPDTAEPEYDVATTYAEFDQVSVITADSHLVYESLVDSNLGNAVTDDTKWILKGNTNRFRMFDWNQGNPSTAASPLTVVIRPGQRIDAIMLDGLKAAILDMTVRDGIDGAAVFTMDGYLLQRNVTTFFEYFFDPFTYIEKVATFAVPAIADPVIYLTLSDPSGIIELSRFAFGLSTYVGATQNQNPIVDSDNYSEITWDAFGKATLSPVPSVPTNEVKIAIKSNRLNQIRQFRERANAKPAVWSGLDDDVHDYAESLLMFGVYRNFQIDLTDPNFPVINLSLKGI